MTDEEKKKDQIEKKIIIEDQKNPMEEKKQKNPKSDSLENKSLEELHKQIEKGKRKASRSFVFAVAAVIAIIAIGVAWFVVNTKVSAIGARISADNPVSFELGSKGQRQSAEQTYLKDDSGNTVLNKGTEEKYTKYVDTSTGEETRSSLNLQTGTSNLAWYLGSQANFWPGASGKLEFYIIPKQEGLKNVTVTLQMEAYRYKSKTGGSTEDPTVVKITENAVALNNLLSGHILFFDKLDDTNGYSGWHEPSTDVNGANMKFTITASDLSVVATSNDTSSTANATEATFQKDIPYKVTLYWVWPKYFRNYIYNSRSQNGDLFADISIQNKDYTKLIKFAQGEAKEGTGRLFADVKEDEIVGLDKISSSMSDTTLDAWSKYYNQADETIGGSVDYVYIDISVE